MAERAITYPRFSLAQRLEHWLMTISFTVLGVTGLPQRYARAAWADQMIMALGGIETVRIIHRASAVVFMLVLLYHFMAVAYKIYVLRARPSMLPGLSDVTDTLDTVRYQLGLARRAPRLPRYNFAEKIEYWAVIWGGVLMTITGFMLWNPIATTRFLPGEFVPAAKAAHSAEALLAILAIIIWHVYWVHLRTFNRAMITGKLTREQMVEEHAAELAEIEAGRIPPPLPREIKRRRERIFLPVATMLALTSVFGVFLFTTFEQTAITTIPPAETALAFVPATPTPTNTPRPTPTPAATPTPLPTATPVAGQAEPVNAPVPSASPAGPLSVPAISHELEERQDCLVCHGSEGLSPFPENHLNWPLSTCLVCHSTEADSAGPAGVVHTIEGREECLLCHATDLLPESHGVAGFSSEDCLLCHSPLEPERR
jgi:formate dehydrogenase gamma subunit